MRRFFLPRPLDGDLFIDGADAWHISRVLRMTKGDQLAVVGEDGQVAAVSITALTEDRVFLRLLHFLEDQGEPFTRVWLAQGLAKGDKMEFIIQKAVELGAAGVIPLATEHAVVRLDENKRTERVKRWQKIAQEAAKQCGRSRVPLISPVMDLAGCLAVRNELALDIRSVMLYEGETPCSFREILPVSGPFSSFLLIIGPEGGFSAGEVAYCRQHAVDVASLGPRILRTETAALAALAVIMYHCGELGG